MNTRTTTIFLLSALLLNGCFEHREAPERVVIATGIEEAINLKETVQKVDLCDATGDALPAALGEMPHLIQLIMRRSDFTDLSILPQLTQLRVLDLSESKLEEFPPEVIRLPNLNHLYLSDNTLKELPTALADLRELTYLNLDRNRLATLPDALGDLAQLRWLRLNHNRLTALPGALGTCTQLQRIYLKGNSLTELPATLAQCELIEDITLADNKLKAFPPILTKLPQLRNLDLSRNPITEWPVDDIGEMRSLRLLTLTGCKVPKEIQTQLRDLLPDTLITF